jgi:TolB protein
VALGITALPLLAQPTGSSVSIGLVYQAGTRPGLLVLPMRVPFGDSLQAIIQRDLDYGDRVQVLPSSVPTPAPGQPLNFALYAQLGAKGVVTVGPGPGGSYRIQLHDVTTKKVVGQGEVALPSAPLGLEWRQAVHGLSDAVELWATGVRGIAQSRIAFVRGDRVWVVDSDGENARPVTEAGLSPAWHPGGRALAYHVLGDAGSRIVVKDLESGAQRTLRGTGGGLNMSPTVAPDGRTVVYAHGEANGTDLMAIPWEDGPARRVTVGRGSDNVSPTFGPDGRRIAFTSGRAGHPEVYIADADGTNAELLTAYAFGDQNYRSNPAWSPDGRLIAFQSLTGGQFQIATISLLDRQVRQVTSEARNDDPSWAADSRHLVFTSRRSGTEQLWIVDVETGRLRQLTRGGTARMAAWSPRLGTQP